MSNSFSEEDFYNEQPKSTNKIALSGFRKKIEIIAAIIALPLFLFIKIGAIPYSPINIIVTFFANKNSFNYIAEKMVSDETMDVYYNPLDKPPYKYGDSSLNDTNDIKFIYSVIKVTQVGNYSSIYCSYYNDYLVVEFVPDNYTAKRGRGIVYCEEPLEDYDDPCRYCDEYACTYVPLGDGWYYYYSSYKLPYG